MSEKQEKEKKNDFLFLAALFWLIDACGWGVWSASWFVGAAQNTRRDQCRVMMLPPPVTGGPVCRRSVVLVVGVVVTSQQYYAELRRKKGGEPSQQKQSRPTLASRDDIHRRNNLSFKMASYLFFPHTHNSRLLFIITWPPLLHYNIYIHTHTHPCV